MGTAAKTVIISNALGFHARPAIAFSQTAAASASTVTVRRTDNDEQADATSVLGLLTLALVRGTEIEIKAKGDDAEAAVQALVDLVKSGFGEG